MAKCTYIRKKKRRVCAGDMKDPITLNFRDIQAPLFNTVDFDENFQPIDQVNPQRLSLVETVDGVTYFDGKNTEINVTHNIYISYDPQVNASVWIEFDGRRIDILKVEDYDERKEFMKLTCNDEGLVSREASKI